jgi:hypothetical protein
MRVLFYGGCHAAALRKIFDRYAPEIEHVDHLTNFRLIQAKAPFPYSSLNRFDWVVFNPILNKQDYNTTNLREYCRGHGIRCISYPWLQWGGYFPGVTKTPPPWYSGWWISGLDVVAEKAGSFDAFCDAVLHGNALAEDALSRLDATTTFLRRLESHADLSVVPFILDNFRDQRLFLTPDHANTALYKHLVWQIADALSCRIDESFYHSTREVQEGITMPILPSVGRALGLKFPAGDFENTFVLGHRVFSLVEFLKLHYYRKDIRSAWARTNTRLRSAIGPDAGGEPIMVKANDRLLVRMLPRDAASAYRQHDVLAALAGSAKLRKLVDRAVRGYYFYSQHWTYSRTLKPKVDVDEKLALAA